MTGSDQVPPVEAGGASTADAEASLKLTITTTMGSTSALSIKLSRMLVVSPGAPLDLVATSTGAQIQAGIRRRAVLVVTGWRVDREVVHPRELAVALGGHGVGDVNERATRRRRGLPPVVHGVKGRVRRHVDLAGRLDRASSEPMAVVPRVTGVGDPSTARPAGFGQLTKNQ